MALKTKDEEKAKKPPSNLEISLKRSLAKAFPTLAKVSGTSATQLETVKPVLPVVNMLPASMLLEVKKRAMIRGFAAITAILGIIIAGVWFAQGAEIQAATTDVEYRQFETQLVQSEVDKLKPVGVYFDQLQERLNLASLIYMEQADYSSILLGLQAATPPGVTISSVSIEFVSPYAEEVPTCGSDTSPFLDQTIRPLGCVSFTGVASDTLALTTFIQQVDAVEFILYPFVAPGQPTGTGEVSFTGTAAISPAASVAEAAAELVDVSDVEGLTPVIPNDGATGGGNE